MLQLVLGTGLTAAALPLSAARGAVQRVGLISDLNSSYGSTRYIPAVDQGLDQLIGLQPDLVCAADSAPGSGASAAAAPSGLSPAALALGTRSTSWW